MKIIRDNLVIGDTLEEINYPKSQYEILEEASRRYSDNIAIDYFGRRITYRELKGFVDSVSAQLPIKKGDVVLVAMQNIPQFIITEYAIWKKGGIAAPVNPTYTVRELEYFISDFKPKLMVASCEAVNTNIPTIRTNPETFHEIPSELKEKWKIVDCQEELDLKSAKREEKENVKPNDLALLGYTSGTTGKPKGVPITHSNIFASSVIYKTWFKINSDKDKMLGVAPFFHITGQVSQVTAPIYSGIEIVMSFRFDPKHALRTIEEKKTTITVTAATAYTAMLSVYNGEDLSSMRIWGSGGMHVPRALELEWRKKIGTWIYVGYGLTETTSPAIVWPYPYDGDLPVDPETGIVSAGIPVYNTEVMIGGDGEIFIRGPQVISGYWGMEGFKDGWLPTGDIGKIINGWVYILDRKKDVINASGFKVMPREVEEVLSMHPAVYEAAVIGVPDPYRGENVVAYVKLKDGYRESEELKNEIISFCRKNLAPYKVPREIRFVNEIPKTPSGKLMRRAFKEKTTT